LWEAGCGLHPCGCWRASSFVLAPCASAGGCNHPFALRLTANPWLVSLLVLGSTSSVRTGCVCILDLAGCGSLFVLQAQCERSPLLMTFAPCSAFIPFNAFAPCSAFIPFNAGLGVFFSPAGTSGCPLRWTPGTLDWPSWEPPPCGCMVKCTFPWSDCGVQHQFGTALPCSF